MSISFFITAHEDDWQLFRPSAGYMDLANHTNHTVFVMTSAGDAGTLDCWWRARERGVIASIYAALSGATTVNPTLPPQAFEYGTASINGKSLVKVTIYFNGATATLYLLRLPDGNGDGSGFERTGYVSMLQLFNGSGDVIEPSVDPDCRLPDDDYYTRKSIHEMNSLPYDATSSVRYDGWQDFVETIGGIIATEMSSHDDVNAAWINFPDWCYQCSPGDHADHKATAYAVSQAIGALSAYGPYEFGRAEWPSYAEIRCSKNLDAAQQQQQAVVCSAYVVAAYDFILSNYADCAFCVDEIAGKVLAGGDYLLWPDWPLLAGWQYCRIVAPGQRDTPTPRCGPCGTSPETGTEDVRRLLKKRVQDARDLADRTPK